MNSGSTSIRLNPFKGLDGPAGEAVPWSPHGRILPERPVFTLDPLFHAGCYYVQDSSAMFVGHLFRKVLRSVVSCAGEVYVTGEAGVSNPTVRDSSPASGQWEASPSGAEATSPGSIRPIRVLDLCAAPGGKTTDLAASLRESYGDNFLLVANEVMKQRVAILSDNVAIWGDPNVAVTSADPAAFASLKGWFDIIVADVPCSGEGMFRKDPRALEQWSEENVALCAARQKRILADVWPSLRQGGALVYSTCTYESCENDDNLEWAADKLGGSIIEPMDEFSGSGVRRTRCGNLLKVGEVPGEGQWAGALIKTGNDGELSDKAYAKAFDSLRPRRFGQSPGEDKSGVLIPDPDWALSLNFDPEAFPVVELDTAAALSFLHRDALVLPDIAPGLNIVSYRGHPLGFVKNVGKRCNNLHPHGRKILMDINRR